MTATNVFKFRWFQVLSPLRRYVKYLYRHLFFEYTCKKARITQEIAPPNLWQGLFQGAVSYRPKIVLWVPNTLSCDLTAPYLQRVKVLIRYETIYFQPRKNPRNIFAGTSSNPRNSGMLHVKIFLSVKSQLRLVGSHKTTNLGAVAHGALE